jgi:hypothetical protein
MNNYFKFFSSLLVLVLIFKFMSVGELTDERVKGIHFNFILKEKYFSGRTYILDGTKLDGTPYRMHGSDNVRMPFLKQAEIGDTIVKDSGSLDMFIKGKYRKYAHPY